MSPDTPLVHDASPAPDGLQVLPVPGLPDFRPGDDLASAIAAAAPWLADGDVLVVTSKVLSKVEGRLVPSPADPDERDALRRRLIDENTVRLVAQVARTKIVENHLGIVAAAAGIDASNVRADEIALLPVDPDASAAALVAEFARRGRRIGVIVTDTQGRAWRMGVTDVAIGAAGVVVLDDHRGGVDAFGNQLVVTQVAVGDELAAAADLVKGKLSGVPVAVVRGMAGHAVPGTPRGASTPEPTSGRALIRPRAEDLFRLGTDLSIAQGRAEAALLARPATAFSGEGVDPELLDACLAAAAAVPMPHGGDPVGFVTVREHRDALLQAIAASLEADLADDGVPPAQIAARSAAAELPAGTAEVVLPFLTGAGRHDYPDPRRARAEQRRFDLSAGAAIQTLLVALAGQGLAATWTVGPLFCPAAVRTVLDLPADWEPLGLVAIGRPVEPLTPRTPPPAAVVRR